MSGLMLRPADGPLDAVVEVPGSKSLTNRALVLAALADGKSRLTGALPADDTRQMADCLCRLGVEVVFDAVAATATVHGCSGHLPVGDAELHCGDSGTTMRFCTALVSLGMGEYRLEGSQRMHERPIGALVDGLRRLGARVEYLGVEGYPPLTVHARGLDGGTVEFSSPPSSQMISGLLMAAPYARGDVFLDIRGPLVSAPYVAMTLAVMDEFGVSVVGQVNARSAKYVVAASQRYRGREYAIEPDASNASYFLAAPAVAGGRVTVRGLGTASVQGDARFVNVLERMGCSVGRGTTHLTVQGPGGGQRLRGVDVDLNDMPDMVQTLAVVALFAEGPTHIRNVANLRLKETDRLTALARELGRLGATVEVHADGLTVHPPGEVTPAAVDTYNDHRMAMSFSLAGLAADGIVINDPGCVSKTFPDFFDRWRRMANAG
ncbi:MAG TPA: 3-phosphoshikimate 1-carboxyvinyltransferase [Phycisphaerae bacterium]|nr:3-phosphoshikimate 1-carboxyvinyltransferase [Phycisphaerae bacterium]